MLEEENQWGNRLTQVHLEKAVKMVSVFYDIVSSPSDQSLKASSISSDYCCSYYCLATYSLCLAVWHSGSASVSMNKLLYVEPG